MTPDSCDLCGVDLVAGEYGGGCEVCDYLLCPACEARHPEGPCDGEGRLRLVPRYS